MRLKALGTLILLLVAAMFTCPPDDRARSGSDGAAVHPAPSGRFDRLVRRVREVERRARALDTSWAEVRRGYVRAHEAFIAAELAYQAAARSGDEAATEFSTAREAWDQARWRWELYQQLVLAAAAIDAHNLERFRSLTGNRDVSSLDCSAGMSTNAFRSLLLASGTSLTDVDIDHIVPRSLGGADHPANYQLLDRSLNRSLQDSWGPAKCRLAGNRCAGAIAVSRKCGTFRGPEF